MLKLIASLKHRGRGGQLVSIDPRRNKLSLYKQTVELMTREHGSSFDYVQIFVDPEVPSRFWLKPCESSDDGARKLNQSSPSNRSLTISLLLQELDPRPETTVRVKVEWDTENSALRGDLEKSSGKEVKNS